VIVIILGIVVNFAMLALGLYESEPLIVAIAIIGILFGGLSGTIHIIVAGHRVRYNKQSNRK